MQAASRPQQRFFIYKNMVGYVYKTMNLINGKIYIGQKQSQIYLPNYFGSGYLIKKAIKKYDKENFYSWIICECNSLNILNKKEIYYIKKYNSTNRKIGYNITIGGNAIMKGRKHSEETKKKIGAKNKIALKGHRPSELAVKNLILSHKGIKRSEETKNKISKTLKGHLVTQETINKIKSHKRKPVSKETREKISKSNIGKHKMSDENKKIISIRHKGFKHSEATKKKISISHKGKIPSEETRKKLSLIGKGRKQNPEWIRKRTEKNIGKRRTQESKEKNRQSHLGKKFSIETKIKMSVSQMGHLVSEETKNKISNANKSKNK
jgi:hypothetical protein